MRLEIAGVVLAELGDCHTQFIDFAAPAIRRQIQEIQIQGGHYPVTINRGNAQIEVTVKVHHQFELSEENLTFNLRHLAALANLKDGELVIEDYEGSRFLCDWAIFTEGNPVTQIGVGLEYEYKFRLCGKITYERK